MKIAVIGCGKQGMRHLTALSALSEVRALVAVDRDLARGRAAAERFGADWRPSLDLVFADRGIDAVVIATPTDSHATLARFAVAAGKHFLCEKPFGADAAAALRIAADAARRGIVGRVGYLYRFAPAIAAAREAVRQELLGRVDAAVFVIAGRGDHAPWKHRRLSRGGVENELAAHMIDLALWCFGPFADGAVTARHRVHGSRVIEGVALEVDAMDRIAARFTSRAGVSIAVEGDFAAPRFCQWLVIRGERGFVRASIDPGFPSHIHLDQACGSYAAGMNRLPVGPDHDLYRLQASDFLDAMIEPERAVRQGSDLAEAARLCAWLETLAAAPITASA